MFDKLDFIEENKRVERLPSGEIINTYPDGRVAVIEKNATVSMNCFGFSLPIRVPLPAAIMTTYFSLSILLQIDGQI